MFIWFVIISFTVLGLAWLAYFIYNYREDQKEKNQPKPRSEKYQQAQETMAEYAKRMAEFKKPKYDKKQ